MRVPITGGAGFIGSFPSEALVDAGHEVFVLDNLSTDSLGNIEHLKPRPASHFQGVVPPGPSSSIAP